jgi:hypothetical protein
MQMDAFQLNWGMYESYAFSPLPLLPKVLAKIIADKASMILVAPLWPRRLWFPQLLLLSCDIPRILPLIPKMLSQILIGQGTLLHPDTTTLKLVGWRLSGDRSKTTDFLSKLSTSCWQPEESPPVQCMTQDGRPTVAGAVRGVSIPLWLL